MRKIATVILLLVLTTGYAQPDLNPPYQPTATSLHDLVHTKLDVKFDYNRSWMYGKEWITLHPHFYATDSVTLDAKGMDIKQVSVVKAGKNLPLTYRYDNMQLHIRLDHLYKAGEDYTLYIDYTAKPDEFKGIDNNVMENEKGLFFINPLGKEAGKPTQIWTQGETEANSYWLITIDKPNQKTTDEIIMTVPQQYVTLSNGILKSQQKNSDGTRTDTWKMDLPHAPYLLFMGVGEYAIIKDRYKGKEVSYYVEKEYAPVARKIFGYTPEMMAYFSKITGVDFPWQKYAQITGRDYIFGAMENTSATIHSDAAQQDARQLVDGNSAEETIAHELFHQWFGDYVTAESWSNITVNESFATLGPVLWSEYKYGKEAGLADNYANLQVYLGDTSNVSKNLVRFNYYNPFEAFDGVGYHKGGNILYMFRSYLGDSAFYQSIHNYLSTNKFKSAEAQNLRLAFEATTGQDLNWFFDQWYYGSGHPKLDISYGYDDAAKMAKVYILQTQEGKPFKLMLPVDVYEGTSKKRYNVWAQNAADTFLFPVKGNPELVNVDADKTLVGEKEDHKTSDNFIYQYRAAGNYIDRREAIAYFLKIPGDPKALAFFKIALKDPNDRLKRYFLDQLDVQNDTLMKAIEPEVKSLAMNDPVPLVKAAAMEVLGFYKKMEYKPVFIKHVYDSSYTVAGKSLVALGRIDSAEALKIALSIKDQPAKGMLQTAIGSIITKYSTGNEVFDYLEAQFKKAPFIAKFDLLNLLTTAAVKTTSATSTKRAVDIITGFRDSVPAVHRMYLDISVDEMLQKIITAKQAAGDTELVNYITSKLVHK